MTNEAAILIIAAFWLLSGRGLNLCFVILCYYALYLLSTDLPSELVIVGSYKISIPYYLTQSALDITVMLSALALSVIYKKSVIICFAYAAIVATSLFCEISMLLDQAFRINALSFIHEARQQYSIPLDLFFAFIGSRLGERLLVSVFLLTGFSLRYNRHNSD